jgi:hypothetical protein
MERNRENILTAYEKGYRIKNGKVYSPSGLERKTEQNKCAPKFKIRSGKKMVHIYVSRLLGYQKFGDQIFDSSLYVYHLNGNPSDNTDDNLVIGTYTQAQMSKTLESRMNSALNATSKVRKHDHEKIIEMYKNGMSYKQIMLETGIKSKGTISFICSKIK